MHEISLFATMAYECSKGEPSVKLQICIASANAICYTIPCLFNKIAVNQGELKRRIKMKMSKMTLTVSMAIAVLVVPTVLAGGNAVDTRPSPVGVAFLEDAQFPKPDVDVMGMRLCFIYGRNANVQGLDIGIFGCGVEGNMFGLQLSGVLNDVGSSWGTVQFAGIANICAEDLYGCQLSGIANSTAQSLYGGQLSIFNQAQTLYGTQIGLFNKSDNAYGLQIGLVNIVEGGHGLMQIGLVNVIKSNKNQFFPIINMGF